MEQQELFEKTKTAFSDRQAKNKRCHYPTALKKDVIRLLEHYPVKLLCHSFGITENRLNGWVNTRDHQDRPALNFMKLTLDDSMPAVTNTETVTLTLSLPYHCTLSLSNQPVNNAITLVCAVLKEVVPCSI